MITTSHVLDLTSKNQREKGVVVFIVAATVVVLLAVAGLAIDLSVLYNVKTDLQNATDASALAGASQVDGTAQGINKAVTQALAAANKYHFNNTPVALTASDITFGATRDGSFVSQGTALSDPSIVRFVRVDSRKTMALALIKILPGVGDTRDVSAFSIAGRSLALNLVCDGLLPLAPAPMKNGSGSVDNYQVGQVYTIRFAGGNDDITVGQGNYLVLDFSPILGGSSGADLVRNLLEGGASGCIGVGDIFCSKPGVNSGPVRQGLNNRFDSDTDTREGIRFRDALNPSNAYQGNGRRVLPLPIASRTPPPVFTAIGNGRDCPIYVYDVVCFFLRDRVSGGNIDVTGEFIGQCSVGSGKADPSRPPSGGSGLPGETRLVLSR